MYKWDASQIMAEDLGRVLSNSPARLAQNSFPIAVSTHASSPLPAKHDSSVLRLSSKVRDTLVIDPNMGVISQGFVLSILIAQFGR